MHGETAKQGSLLNFGNMQDTEEKCSISNTEQKKNEYQCWLPCQPVWVGLWNTALQGRDCQQSNQHLLNLVSKEEQTHSFQFWSLLSKLPVFPFPSPNMWGIYNNHTTKIILPQICCTVQKSVDIPFCKFCRDIENSDWCKITSRHYEVRTTFL